MLPRRTFLMAAASMVGTAALDEPNPSIDPSLGSAPDPPGDRVGWAVAGLGDFATKQILPAFAACKRSRLVALISGSPEKARALGARYGVPESSLYGYDDAERLRANPAIDVVYVITPNGLHKTHTVMAARAGKHVLCEKPMANAPADCEAMIAACREAGRTLMIAYRAQFDPFNREAIRLCRAGSLGRLVSFVGDHGRILDPSKPHDRWRMNRDLAGGGSLVDIGIYNVNAARFLTGEEPVEAWATLQSPADDPRFREVEETCHFTLRFPSGCLANGASSYGWSRVKRYRIIGTEGWADLDPATEYYRHRLVVGRDEGHEVREIDEQDQFALMMDHFSASIREGKPPRTPGEEGLRDVRILHALYESARSGRPVRLDGAASPT